MTDHTALRETLERTLRDRFGTGPNRAADEGFSEVVIAEILAALMPPIAAAMDAQYERALEEHEASVCPEDVGCTEYIAALNAELSALRLRQAEWKRERERCEQAEGQVAARDAQIADWQFHSDHFREEWQHATATLERWRFHLASLGFTQERLDRLAYLGSLGSRRPTPPEKG
jgi:hypothetical protein